MKKLKKTIILVLATTMLLGATLTVHAAWPQARCSCGAPVIKTNRVGLCSVTFSDGHHCPGSVYHWECSNPSCHAKYSVDFCSSCHNMN